ncbi:MAG: hypothetical protein ACR2PT_16905 [Endozoicomonas sp.]
MPGSIRVNLDQRERNHWKARFLRRVVQEALLIIECGRRPGA